MIEVESHQAIVGIGHDAEIGLRLMLIDIVEGANEPIAALYALRSAVVVNLGAEPDGVIDMLKYIHLAGNPDGIGETVRLEHPS